MTPTGLEFSLSAPKGEEPAVFVVKRTPVNIPHLDRNPSDGGEAWQNENRIASGELAKLVALADAVQSFVAAGLYDRVPSLASELRQRLHALQEPSADVAHLADRRSMRSRT